jgi:hypothetical protein
MKTGRMTVVVMGMAGRAPFAGVAWQVLHYLEGLRRLHYDVLYLEDTGDWPYDTEQNTITNDCSFTVRYLASLLGRRGLSDRWAYRSGADGTLHGLDESALRFLLRRAAVLINLTGATVLRDDYLRVPVRIYLETDPVLPQIEVALGRTFTIDLLAAHTHHFTYGENLGAPGCGVPLGSFHYLPTRQPVILDWWYSGEAPSGRITTIGNWQQSGKDVEWNEDTYLWSKHHEFLKVIDLPRRSGETIELALSQLDQQARTRLRACGWRMRDPAAMSRDLAVYRRYIQTSKAEFTVAKDQNVRLRSGWFSDRSACYLAAGRPVVTQDTAFNCALPIGCGLFAWRTMEDIIEALGAIRRDYAAHSRGARAVAEEYFAAESVLSDLMSRSGVVR